MSVLSEIRSLSPQKRALTVREARSVAERQALRLRKLTGYLDEPMLPNDAIIKFTRMKILIATSMRFSGMTGWDPESRMYQVVINGTDHPARQRFTLCHEAKHIIDYTTHENTYRSFGAYSAHDQAEDICDWFAGNLLIPRHLLKAAWTDGIQNTRDLAQLFGVSKAAMRVRLRQVGLVDNGRHAMFFRESVPLLDDLTESPTELVPACELGVA